ncbi:heterodisulfide reductase subunit C [Desulfofundulus australicus DSM 11792]|uniref:Heterodisulfide reductase subunit C n=1 Tax=Desulfofundulus australicus DSM 11792 TaxID=1121425 RepID=A0A1M5BRM2_9FIRM|nr:4Fe-4S dicluster domain-containing protein [Desulfofundulus australicus]SHF44917.1 heterodisulfide reductase subunit C [Desulfofundulus australicus DSM 11792]
MPRMDPLFAEEVNSFGRFDARACLNCGVCSAVCPMGIELLPRKLFRYVLLGVKDRVLENVQAVYSCLLCRLCEVNCPAQVRVAENVRFLRYYLNKKVFQI